MRRGTSPRYEAAIQAAPEARARHNLSDIVRPYTNLKKAGRELAGLCPFHDERSPSFQVNDAKGTYHCFGCGRSGDAITFLIEKAGANFIESIEILTGDRFPVVSDEERAKRKEADARETAERIALARSIWAVSVPPHGTPAEVYARSRGITIDLPETVRFVMTPRWRDPETGEVGRDFPAMACALQDVHGAIVGVQCVFLAAGGRRKYERVRDDGTKAKAKLSFGIVIGSALRLGPPSDHVILCEGPEDGLTLWQEMPDRAIWVACGTAMLPRVALPSSVNFVSLAGDNNDAGRAAVEAATAAYISQGLPTASFFPPAEFKDWNDQLRGVRI